MGALRQAERLSTGEVAELLGDIGRPDGDPASARSRGRGADPVGGQVPNGSACLLDPAASLNVLP